jgi:hypothetical protein
MNMKNIYNSIGRDITTQGFPTINPDQSKNLIIRIGNK